MDFYNTKLFGEVTIDSNIILPETDSRMIALEHNAKQACKLFIPFRKLAELKTNGKYLPTFRKWINDGKLKEEHLYIKKYTRM